MSMYLGWGVCHLPRHPLLQQSAWCQALHLLPQLEQRSQPLRQLLEAGSIRLGLHQLQALQ
jgi:hypothetical protein